MSEILINPDDDMGKNGYPYVTFRLESYIRIFISNFWAGKFAKEIHN